MKSIQAPKSDSIGNESIEIEKNMVIVGANGSGKTRFSVVLEQNNNPSKRISAQRYLQLAEDVPKQNFATAEATLRNAYKNQSSINPQNDYNQVLISLFAEESRRDASFVALSRESKEKIDVPISVKESVVEVWNFIFPYRAIKLENDKVRAVSEVGDFSGTEMSDGEKVGLYLISQILLADKGCILIIDEPELHLHKSLMVRLWNKLEEQRADCTFIYITHDLDFAVCKTSDKLIWIQSYKNNIWNWIEVDSNKIIPENLFLEVLGSRKPILFVEGDKGSLDIQFYQSYYNNFSVIPCGSCEKVIEAVKGLKTHKDLHQNKIFGLVDIDFRTVEQLAALKDIGVFSINVNEIENVFLVPGILKMVCKHLSKEDQEDEIINEIKKAYSEEKQKLLFSISKNRMHRYLGEMFGAVNDKVGYDKFKVEVFSELDKLQDIVLPQDDAKIEEILKVYPHKGLVYKVQGKLELSKNGYKNQIKSFMTSEKRPELLTILKLYFPEIS
jgi:ABC-type cobalamin/Fe3+-siderophores transport system ATPase subunit